MYVYIPKVVGFHPRIIQTHDLFSKDQFYSIKVLLTTYILTEQLWNFRINSFYFIINYP